MRWCVHRPRPTSYVLASSVTARVQFTLIGVCQDSTGGEDPVGMVSGRACPAQSSMFYAGLRRMARVLRRSLESGGVAPWTAGGGKELASAEPSQRFFEAAVRSMGTRGSWEVVQPRE